MHGQRGCALLLLYPWPLMVGCGNEASLAQSWSAALRWASTGLPVTRQSHALVWPVSGSLHGSGLPLLLVCVLPVWMGDRQCGLP